MTYSRPFQPRSNDSKISLDEEVGIDYVLITCTYTDWEGYIRGVH
jgi:hypothetical protein